MMILDRVRAIRRDRPRLLPYVAADFTIFCVGLVVYLALRAGTTAWPRPFHFPTGIMTVAMLMFTIAASFVMHVAVKSIGEGDFALTQRMLALALIGWLTFLFLLTMEWGRLYLIEHVSLHANPWGVPVFGACYYGLTGYQALHVLCGSVALAGSAHKPTRERVAELTLWVDFTSLLFVALSFLLILPSADLNGF